MSQTSSSTNDATANADKAKRQKDKQSLGKALGRITSGVFVLTLANEGKPHGMLATWVSQAAFEPPMITVAVNKERALLRFLEVGSSLTLNILSGQNTAVFKAFARPAIGELDHRFAGLKVKYNQAGGPIFSDSVAYLNCRVESFCEAGDHVLAVAVVTSGDTLNVQAEPMVHLRKNGFQY